MINFNFGKKKPDKKQLIIVSIVMATIVGTLSQCTGVGENKIWDLIDEVQRKYFPGTILNELVIKDPEKLQRRVTRDVDRAIEEYNRLTGNSEGVIMSKPRFIQKEPDGSEAQKLLGGEMRLCAPWVDDCPKE